MDPTYDIPTKDEDLDSNYFNTIQSGAYYTNPDGTGPDGKNENDARYLSGKHVFKDADMVTKNTKSSQDVMNKKIAQNVKTIEDADSASARLSAANQSKEDLFNNTTERDLSWLEAMLKRVKEGFTVETSVTRGNKSKAVKEAIAVEQAALAELTAATDARTLANTRKTTAVTKAGLPTATDADKTELSTATTALTAAESRVTTARTALLTASKSLAEKRTASIQAEDLALENAISAQRIATTNLSVKTTAHADAETLNRSTPTTANAEAVTTALAAKTAAEDALVEAVTATEAARKAASAARIAAGMAPTTRQVNDLSDNMIWDISNNQSLYNVNGILNTGAYVSPAELEEVNNNYKKLDEKCKTQLKIDCIADFGTGIGDDLCCGQTGVLQNPNYVCPKEKPKCQSFKCGSKFGQCV
jgi:GTP:adenosylcobinamide-phosphate guanylyltransferase